MVEQKFAFNFEFFLYCLFTLVKDKNVLLMGLIVSFPDDIEVSPDQLKRLK